MYGGAIGGPAVAAVIAVNFAKTVLQQFRAERHPHAFQGKVYKDAEKLPVAVRDGVGVDLPQPCSKVLFFGVRKRGPQLFRCGEDAAGNGSHLHITLVVFPGGAPIFGVFRVGAGGKTLAVDGFKFRLRAAAHPEGHQRPQRAASLGVPFPLCHQKDRQHPQKVQVRFSDIDKDAGGGVNARRLGVPLLAGQQGKHQVIAAQQGCIIAQ